MIQVSCHKPLAKFYMRSQKWQKAGSGSLFFPLTSTENQQKFPLFQYVKNHHNHFSAFPDTIQPFSIPKPFFLLKSTGKKPHFFLLTFYFCRIPFPALHLFATFFIFFPLKCFLTYSKLLPTVFESFSNPFPTRESFPVNLRTIPSTSQLSQFHFQSHFQSRSQSFPHTFYFFLFFSTIKVSSSGIHSLNFSGYPLHFTSTSPVFSFLSITSSIRKVSCAVFCSSCS